MQDKGAEVVGSQTSQVNAELAQNVRPTISPATSPKHWRWVLNKAGIDQAVGYGLLAKSFLILTRPLNLLMMVLFLTVEEQGFQYTFASVLGLKVFFELGLGLVVLQFASHEAGQLERSPAGTLEGNADAKSRLASLVRTTAIAFAGIGGLFAVVVYALGWAFFSGNGGDASVAWQIPWLWTVLVTATTMPLGALGAILHGCGQIAEIAKVQFVTSVAQSLAAWGLLAAGLGLLAGPASATVAAALQAGGLLFYGRTLLLDLWRQASGPALSWRHDIWPMQWKIALSWLSTYFIAQLFTPLAFTFHGPRLAAQVGLTMGIGNMLQGIGWTWVGTNLPVLTNYVARRQYRELDRTFFRLVIQSTMVVVVGGLAAFGVAVIAAVHGWDIGSRVLPPAWVAVVLLTALCWHLIDCLSNYLNCFRRDPFLHVKLLCAALTAPVAYFACRFGDPYWMLAGYLAISGSVGLGLGTWLFGRLRREWQMSAPVAGPQTTGLDTARA